MTRRQCGGQATSRWQCKGQSATRRQGNNAEGNQQVDGNAKGNQLLDGEAAMRIEIDYLTARWRCGGRSMAQWQSVDGSTVWKQKALEGSTAMWSVLYSLSAKGSMINGSMAMRRALDGTTTMGSGGRSWFDGKAEESKMRCSINGNRGLNRELNRGLKRGLNRVLGWTDQPATWRETSSPKHAHTTQRGCSTQPSLCG